MRVFSEIERDVNQILSGENLGAILLPLRTLHEILSPVEGVFFAASRTVEIWPELSFGVEADIVMLSRY